MKTKNVALIIDERSSLSYMAISPTKSMSNDVLKKRAKIISNELSIKHGFNYSEYYVVIVSETKTPEKY